MGSNGTTFRRRVLQGSRVAILGVSVTAMLATTACQATEETPDQRTLLTQPASYSAEDYAEFQRTNGNYWCGIGYDDRTVAVNTATTSGSAYGMTLELVQTGEELVVNASYDTDVYVEAFIVGNASNTGSQRFLVPVPPDHQGDAAFRFEAKDFLGAVQLNEVSACPRHVGDQ